MSTDDLRRILDDADAAAGLRSEVATLTGQVASLMAERDKAVADLAACQASHPEPAAGTVFGACPPKGARPADVVSKWGQGAAVRAFDSDTPTGTWRRPDGAGICHISSKPAIDRPLDEAMVLAWVAGLEPGDMVEVWHELDVKFRNGSLTQQQVDAGIQRKAELHDIITRHRPDLRTVTTYAVWTFQSNGTFDQSGPAGAGYYGGVKAHVVGADFDGIGNLSRYPEFPGAIDNLRAYVDQHGYDGWAVPEFIHPRLAFDPTGAQRATWADNTAAAFAAGGAIVVHLYDYDHRPAQEFAVDSPEYDVWRALI